ncbi:hypothetical protein DIPPA_33136 [Diplonema papillatum]|nr:hypothetical protein DIPPA_33136 [Diplonema papillatum]
MPATYVPPGRPTLRVVGLGGASLDFRLPRKRRRNLGSTNGSGLATPGSTVPSPAGVEWDDKPGWLGTGVQETGFELLVSEGEYKLPVALLVELHAARAVGKGVGGLLGVTSVLADATGGDFVRREAMLCDVRGEPLCRASFDVAIEQTRSTVSRPKSSGSLAPTFSPAYSASSATSSRRRPGRRRAPRSPSWSESTLASRGTGCLFGTFGQHLPPQTPPPPGLTAGEPAPCHQGEGEGRPAALVEAATIVSELGMCCKEAHFYLTSSGLRGDPCVKQVCTVLEHVDALQDVLAAVLEKLADHVDGVEDENRLLLSEKAAKRGAAESPAAAEKAAEKPYVVTNDEVRVVLMEERRFLETKANELGALETALLARERAVAKREELLRRRLPTSITGASFIDQQLAHMDSVHTWQALCQQSMAQTVGSCMPPAYHPKPGLTTRHQQAAHLSSTTTAQPDAQSQLSESDVFASLQRRLAQPPVPGPSSTPTKVAGGSESRGDSGRSAFGQPTTPKPAAAARRGGEREAAAGGSPDGRRPKSPRYDAGRDEPQPAAQDFEIDDDSIADDVVLEEPALAADEHVLRGSPVQARTRASNGSSVATEGNPPSGELRHDSQRDSSAPRTSHPADLGEGHHPAPTRMGDSLREASSSSIYIADPASADQRHCPQSNGLQDSLRDSTSAHAPQQQGSAGTDPHEGSQEKPDAAPPPPVRRSSSTQENAPAPAPMEADEKGDALAQSLETSDSQDMRRAGTAPAREENSSGFVGDGSCSTVHTSDETAPETKGDGTHKPRSPCSSRSASDVEDESSVPGTPLGSGMDTAQARTVSMEIDATFMRDPDCLTAPPGSRGEGSSTSQKSPVKAAGRKVRVASKVEEIPPDTGSK